MQQYPPLFQKKDVPETLEGMSRVPPQFKMYKKVKLIDAKREILGDLKNYVISKYMSYQIVILSVAVFREHYLQEERGKL